MGLTGLFGISGFVVGLILLQSYIPWATWLVLFLLGVRYVSKFSGLTDIQKVINLLKGNNVVIDRIFNDEVYNALEQIGVEKIFGQEHVLKPLIAKIKANAEIPNRKRPFITAAFFGPPGVGKTTLAVEINDAIFKNPQYYNLIESSQYQDHNISSLFGTGRGYVGCDTYGAITGWLKIAGKGVLLVDEPDRVQGDPKRWIQAMMPLLDGRVTEVSTKEEFSTKNTAIFFASNYEHEKLGAIAEKYHSLQGTMPMDELAASIRKEAMKVLEGSIFPKAFLDRLDLIAVFAPLATEPTANILLKEIVILAKSHSIEVEFVDPFVLAAALMVGLAGESTGARDFNRWVADKVNPTLVAANRQKAKKVTLKLGPNNEVCAIITETHQEQAD
jgi:ATP-dependent Clp protease ATP-binding subunit ClpA